MFLNSETISGYPRGVFEYFSTTDNSFNIPAHTLTINRDTIINGKLTFSGNSQFTAPGNL